MDVESVPTILAHRVRQKRSVLVLILIVNLESLSLSSLQQRLRKMKIRPLGKDQGETAQTIPKTATVVAASLVGEYIALTSIPC